jgi:K+/H+ antiporter YhaU regulatory subunit KhtT
LKKLGANVVVSEEIESAHKLVEEVNGRFEKTGVRSNISSLPGIQTKTITIPVGSKVAGKSIRDLDLRYRHGITVLAVTRGGKMHSNPLCDFKFKDRDELLIIGADKDIVKLSKILG